MTYVSVPDGFLDECGLEQGDQVRLTSGDMGFTAEKVEYRRASDE